MNCVNPFCYLLTVTIRPTWRSQSPTDKSIQDQTFWYDMFLCIFISSLPDVLRVPTVLPSPSGDILKGMSLTLTCSADVKLGVNYTWYKSPDSQPHTKDQNLTLTSIQTSDSGVYYCTAENEMMKKTSESFDVDVKCEYKNGYSQITSDIFFILQIWLQNVAQPPGVCLFTYVAQNRTKVYSQRCSQGMGELAGGGARCKKYITCRTCSIKSIYCLHTLSPGKIRR